MRLLALTNFYPPLGYGYGAISRDAMAALAARGHDVTTLAAGGSQEQAGHRVRLRTELAHVPAAWRRPVVGLRGELRNQRLVRELLVEGVDAALAWHMRGIGKGALTLLHDAGVPVLYMLGDLWVVYERPGPPAMWRFWQAADRSPAYRRLRAASGRAGGLGRLRLDPPPIAKEGIVCFASEWLRQRYRSVGFEPCRAHVVPNGLPAEAFAEGERPPLDGRDFEIAFAGRLDETKGADVAIRALARVPGARLSLAGDATRSDLDALHSLVDELHLGERVEFLGLRSRGEVLELMRRADVFAMPGRIEEAFGLVYVEAMAAGAVPVGTGLGAAAEICRDGENCLLVPPGDHLALAAALRRLSDDRALREQLRSVGLTIARSYSLEATLQSVEALIERALSPAS